MRLFDHLTREIPNLSQPKNEVGKVLALILKGFPNLSNLPNLFHVSRTRRAHTPAPPHAAGEKSGLGWEGWEGWEDAVGARH